MLRLALGLGLTAPNFRPAGGSPTPTPGPTPTPTPFTNFVGEGDSLSAPPTGWLDQYQQMAPAGTTNIRVAQSSRRIGLIGELDDGGNTLIGHLTQDVTTNGGQLIWVAPFLTNDFGAYGVYGVPVATRVANIKAALATYYGKVKEKGAKLAFGFCPPTRSDFVDPDGPAAAQTRAAFRDGFRDPAEWSKYCDYYSPVGEQPDFNAADNTALIDPVDKIHPTGLGHAALLSVNKPVLDTLFDAARASSTTVYNSVWPAGQTGVATSTKVKRRMIMSGLAHKGIALTGSNALSSTNGGLLSLNGGTFLASHTGWLYNGDTVDFEVTTASTSNTDKIVDIKIGTEIRSLNFKTSAGGQVTYTHGDAAGFLAANGATTHPFQAATFASAGTALIEITSDSTGNSTGPSGVTVGGVAATKRATQVGMYGDLMVTIWTAAIAEGGAKDIVVTYPNLRSQTAISWGVVTGANPVPVQVVGQAPNGGSPHSTGELTVPVGGLAIGAFGETGGAPLAPSTVLSGTFVDEAQAPERQGVAIGINVAMRTTTGELAWSGGYSAYPRIAVVFAPA